MSGLQEGGKWALAGYLYQIVCAHSVTARLSNLAHNPDHSQTDEIDVLFDLDIGQPGAALIRAQHEQLEDALFGVDDKYVLMQFKYSGSPTPRKITRSQLTQIINRFDLHAKQAIAQGKNVTTCMLVTNRGFSKDGAEQLWENEQSVARGYRLRKRSPYSLQEAKATLEGFASEYGATRGDVNRGIEILIGRVLASMGEYVCDASVFAQDLVEAFTGCRSSRRITIANVTELCRGNLSEFGTNILVDQQKDDPIERDVFQKLTQAASERALVGLYGPGGSGKSVLLWQFGSRILEQGIGCWAVAHARDLQECWVTDTIHHWRNLPHGSRPSDTEQQAIERLVTANPSVQPPILWLALDGIDEGAESAECRSAIKKIVKWFWDKDRKRTVGNRPTATLIVTCRNKDDLGQKWLGLPPSTLYQGEVPLVIHVGNFSASEIIKIAHQTAPELYPALRQSTSSELMPSYRDYALLPYGAAFSGSQPTTINADLWESLQHPAMWLALSRLSQSTRIGAEQGDRESIAELARFFVRWFHWKLTLRRPTFQNLLEDDLLHALQAVAQHSNGNGLHSRDEDWVEPISHTSRFSSAEANGLYDEAVSAGLLVEEVRRAWRWRHRIVYDYLSTDCQTGYSHE